MNSQGGLTGKLIWLSVKKWWVETKEIDLFFISLLLLLSYIILYLFVYYIFYIIYIEKVVGL